ncbi:MAG: GTPase [Acutalibacteraceae bacterium]|nr:GTPase [Acutalibacteraceae bacterium]
MQLSKSTPHLNVMIIGKTGVGKSTLVNRLLCMQHAPTGLGKAVTQEITKYRSKDGFLTMYDTMGLELDKNVRKKSIKEITDALSYFAAHKDTSLRINCILFCINPNLHRLENEEIKLIKAFTNKKNPYYTPVIIALTKAYDTKKVKEMFEYIQSLNMETPDIVPVLAEDYYFDEHHIMQSYGIDLLFNTMLQYSVGNLAHANIEYKRQKSHKITAGAAASSAAAAAVPIPLADAALLIPIQIAMISAITSTYQIRLSKSIMMSMVTSTLGASGATLAGRAITGSLAKLLPGIGTVAGTAINAATAAALTTALGEAYILLMDMTAKGELSENDLGSRKGKKLLADNFKEKMKNKPKLD